MQTFNTLMADMAFIQQDVNTQLELDEKRLNKANENLDQAVKDTEGAQEQLRKKRAKILKSFKRYATCFAVLFVIVSVMIYQIF